MADVFVMDDESSVRTALAMVLEETGHRAMGAASFQEGVRILRENTFDILLVDKNLPDGSGLDLIRRVRNDNADVPVVLMTAYGSVGSARDALDVGVDRHLAKPFPDIFEVPRMVDAILSRPRLRWLPNPGALGMAESVETGSAPVAGLVVVVTSPDSARAARIAEPYLAAGVSTRVVTDLAEAGGAPSDLLVVDIPGRPDQAMLEHFRSGFPDTRIAVVLGGVPTLTELEEVISIGVTSLPSSLDARHDRRALAMLRSLAFR